MDRFTVVGYLPEAVGGESPSSPPLSLASRICLSIRRRKAKILTGNFLAMQTNGSKSLYRDRNSAPPPPTDNDSGDPGSKTGRKDGNKALKGHIK